MVKVFTWPNLQGLYEYIKSHLKDLPSDGFYYTIKTTDGSTTINRMGNSPSFSIVVTNVPPNWQGDLEAWFSDAWWYLYKTEVPPIPILKEKGLWHWYDEIKAHINGRPIPPYESIKYLGKKHIFTKSIIDKNQEKYDKWVETHIPGIKQIHEIDDLISKYQFKPGASNYLAMLKDIRTWINNGQISVSQAQARIDFIKKKLEEMHLSDKPDVPIDTPKNVAQHEYQHVEILPKPVKKTTSSSSTPVVKVVYEKPDTTSKSDDSLLKTIYALFSLQMLKQKTESEKETAPSKSSNVFENEELWIVVGVVIFIVVLAIVIKKKR